MKSYMAVTKRKRTSSTNAPVKRRKTTKGKTTLGNISGRVAPSATTLARYPGPFQGKKRLTFIYENELTSVGGATNLLNASIACNSCFDVDKSGSNCYGNKQPLYFDALISSSGPYKQYKVISWKTTYTVVNTQNTCPLTIWALPPISAPAEIDSAAEADNFPGVKRLYLTPSGGSKSMGTVVTTGHVADVYPSYTSDNTLVGTNATDPSTIIYGGLVIHGSDGTTAPSVYVSIKHEMYTELDVLDAIVS